MIHARINFLSHSSSQFLLCYLLLACNIYIFLKTEIYILLTFKSTFKIKIVFTYRIALFIYYKHILKVNCVYLQKCNIYLFIINNCLFLFTFIYLLCFVVYVQKYTSICVLKAYSKSYFSSLVKHYCFIYLDHQHSFVCSLFFFVNSFTYLLFFLFVQKYTCIYLFIYYA